MTDGNAHRHSGHDVADTQQNEASPLLPGYRSPPGTPEHMLQAPSQTPLRQRAGSSLSLQQQQQRATYTNGKWWSKRIRYYVPIIGWLPNYDLGNLATDVKAGFMVACLLIPQALSYSSLTHLQPVYGLYTALIPALVYGLLGTSRHLAMGPEALVSVLTGTFVKSQLKHLYAAYSPGVPSDDAVDAFASAVASVVALTSGLFTFALGMFRFGFLDSMISESSLRGFISGAAIVVLIGQTRIALGLPSSNSVHSTPWHDLVYMITHLSDAHMATAVISMGAFAFLQLLHIAKRRFKMAKWLQSVPDTLLVIILTTAISSAAKLKAEYNVAVFGNVDGDLPQFSMPRIPSYVDAKDVISSGITITMIGVVESVIVAREYASRNHYAVSSNRELVALGVSNIVGSAFGAYPAFGSLARSKLNDRAQAKSQLSGMVSASLVLVSLLGVLPYLYHLPLGVLAAIIIDAVVSLLTATPHAVAFLIRVQAWSDLFLLVFICVASFVASVEAGILLAVIISLIMVIKRSNMPRIKLLGRSTDNRYEFHPIDGDITHRSSFSSIAEAHSRDQADDGDDDTSYEDDARVEHVEGVLIVRVEEPLYFANAGQLHARLTRLELYGDMRVHPSEDPRMKPTRVVVFDLVGMSDIDGSALEILLSIVGEYSRRQIRVAFVTVYAPVREKFERSGMAHVVGGDYEFGDIQEALLYLEQHFTIASQP